MAELETAVPFVPEPDSDEEIGVIEPADISQIVLKSTDWTTETILAQLERKNIDLNPRLQRRDVWDLTRKSRFIESLLIGLPIPQIVLAERKEERGKYFVIDGKQRLLTLLQYTGRASETEGRHNNFRLSNLEVREDLNGRSFSELGNDMFHRSDLDIFLNQTIRTVVIRNWPAPALLHMVFLRLNTGSVPLSPQELRQAMFPGPFVEHIDDVASRSEAIMSLLKNSEPDFRMRDVEILLRAIAFHIFLDEYSGNMRGFLDDTCQRLNEGWPEYETTVRNKANEFVESLRTATQVFGEGNVGRKWLGDQDKYEGRLNRAVLDIQSFYFMDPVIRESAIAHSEQVVAAYKNLWETDEEFRSSIESTTKSLGATRTRLVTWGGVLRDVLESDFAIPEWNNDLKRIEFRGFWQ